jgi:tRNA dimethylallyltransferase
MGALRRFFGNAQDYLPPLLVILGPTAVGKTGLALSLAHEIGEKVGKFAEIISADSRQIYRYMDIGTAKPTPEQRQQVRHHLLDVVDPNENLGLAQYQKLAYEAIDDIHQRDGVPLLVGGTGQYISAVVEGWTIPEVPPNMALRAELEAFAAAQGSEALYARLLELDPAAAAKIDHRNVRRVIRALEVCLESGQPISELQRKTPPPYMIQEYGLTMGRDRLYEQADRRVDQMMREGFLDEVRHLLEMGYSPTLPSMSGLGYAQLAAHLLNGVSLSEAVEATKAVTHAYIRRQYTWFRGHDQGIVWHNIDNPDARQKLIDSGICWLQQTDV